MTFKITANDQLHFIGIGGIGMSGIAEIMHNIGFKVQGSDSSKNNKNIKRLKKFGLKILDNGVISSVVLEAARRSITRKLKRLGNLKINGFSRS